MRSLDPPPGLSLSASLRWGAAALPLSETALLDARVLLKAALGIDDVQLVADGDRRLSHEEATRFASMIARRARQEPVAYITGVREFWSLPISVEPGVLVPRPDSETLIAAALARRDRRSKARILDLGCGSGALLCALLHEYQGATGTGVDIDPIAVAVTSRNLGALGLAVRGRAVQGDWTAPIAGPVDIVVSNPPYIAETERGRLPHEVEGHEPAHALFAGPDGLRAYRRLAAVLPAAVAPKGLVVLEIGQEQGAAVSALLSPAFPAAALETAKDLAGRDRALIIDLDPGAR